MLLVTSAISATFNDWNKSQDGQIIWRKNCVFDNYTFSIEHKEMGAAEECALLCFNDGLVCSHFNHVDDKCYLMLAQYSTKPTEITAEKMNSTCGYVPTRIWYQSTDDERILLRSNCTFPSSPAANGDQELDYTKSLSHCQTECLNEDQCNAFSYNQEDGKCLINVQKVEMDLKTDLHFQSTSSSSSSCGVISRDIWQVSASKSKSGSRGYRGSYRSSYTPYYSHTSRYMCTVVNQN